MAMKTWADERRRIHKDRKKYHHVGRNTILTGSRSIKLRDGSLLSTDNTRNALSIIHQQLHTHENRFVNKTKEARANQACSRVEHRPKAFKPPTFKEASKVSKELVPVKEVSFEEEISKLENIVRYH